MRSSDVSRIEAWPQISAGEGREKLQFQKASCKAPVRHKLLQPLERPPHLAHDFDLVAPAVWSAAEALPASELDVPASPKSRQVFTPTERPRTSERPLTASRVRPPCGRISFPGRLSLRRDDEEASPLGMWAKPGAPFILPLETQEDVQHSADVCGAERKVVCEGARLSAWAVSSEEGPTTVLEPLVGSRVGKTFAVDLVELVAERCTGPMTGAASSTCSSVDEKSLRYGECFRLRAADERSYLSHGGDGDGFRWKRAGPGQTASDLRGLRFAAHGSELGAPVLLGRPLSLQRVASPAPPSDSDSDCSSDGESSGSELDMLLRAVGEPRRQRRVKARSPSPVSRPEPSSQFQSESRSLVSRFADGVSVFSVAFLPAEPTRSEDRDVCAIDSEVLSTDSEVREEEREVATMECILGQLKRELHQEQEAAEEKRVAWEQSSRRMAELEKKIVQGEKLQQATKEVVEKKRAHAQKSKFAA